MTDPEPNVHETDSEAVARLIRKRQFDLAFDNARLGLLPLFLSVCCYAVLLGNFVSSAVLATWLVAMVGAIGVRGASLVAYARASDKTHQRWIYWHMGTLGLLGLAYGSTALLTALPSQAWQTAVINLWLGGIAVAVLLGQGIVCHLGLAFAIPALVPLLLRLLSSADPILAVLGTGNLLFYTYVFGVITRAQAHTLDEVKNRVQADWLAERLEGQRRHSEQLVETLTREVARRKRAQEALRHARNVAREQSELDHLTGLANYRIFERTLTREWTRAQRDRRPLSVILCDIDRFRIYNDRYGHHAGDRCLMRLAGVINAVAVRPGDLVARYGGEEFAVLLPETNEYAALNLAESIRAKVYELTILHGGSDVERIVTASCGVATIIPEADNREHDLVEAAALALRRAKQAGRNCVFTLYGAQATPDEA